MNKIGDKAVVWIDCLRDEFREVPQVYKNLGPKTDNETGIYNQFYCHVNIAGLKPTWHLEPLRPDYGYGYTLSMGCNPE